jgi:hypothetical protein
MKAPGSEDDRERRQAGSAEGPRWPPDPRREDRREMADKAREARLRPPPRPTEGRRSPCPRAKVAGAAFHREKV